MVIAGCHLVQSLMSSHHAQNVSTKLFFPVLYGCSVTLVSHIDRRTLTEGTRKQGAEVNISICEGGINRPSQKTT